MPTEPVQILSAQAVWTRHRESGEPLILAIKAEGLKQFHRATVLRWIISGKIPAVRMGRRYLTCQSLVDEWAGSGKAGSTIPAPSLHSQAKPGPKPKKTPPDAHAEAVADLRAKGLMN